MRRAIRWEMYNHYLVIHGWVGQRFAPAAAAPPLPLLSEASPRTALLARDAGRRNVLRTRRLARGASSRK